MVKALYLESMTITGSSAHQVIEEQPFPDTVEVDAESNPAPLLPRCWVWLRLDFILLTLFPVPQAGEAVPARRLEGPAEAERHCSLLPSQLQPVARPPLLLSHRAGPSFSLNRWGT